MARRAGCGRLDGGVDVLQAGNRRTSKEASVTAYSPRRAG